MLPERLLHCCLTHFRQTCGLWDFFLASLAATYHFASSFSPPPSRSFWRGVRIDNHSETKSMHLAEGRTLIFLCSAWSSSFVFVCVFFVLFVSLTGCSVLHFASNPSFHRFSHVRMVFLMFFFRNVLGTTLSINTNNTQPQTTQTTHNNNNKQ